MANKIRYGLSNVTIFPITETDTQGRPTYGKPIPVKGAMQLSIKAEGDEDPFYADNVTYYTSFANNGYSGDLELALVPEEVYVEILGQKKDKNGVLHETADDKTKEFAMTYEVNGDEAVTRFLFYRCALSRPDLEGKTKEKGISPTTEKGNITIMPRLNDHRIKAICDEGAKAYESWHTKVYEPEADNVAV